MADKKTDNVEIQHFDSTIAKVDKDGNRVLSNTLEPGEQLAADYDADQAKKRARAEKKGGNDGSIPAPETKAAATDDSASTADTSTDAASPVKDDSKSTASKSTTSK